jgi:hypothetical protein
MTTSVLTVVFSRAPLRGAKKSKKGKTAKGERAKRKTVTESWIHENRG